MQLPRHLSLRLSSQRVPRHAYHRTVWPEIVGVSRQNMRKLMLAHPGSFPTPVHEGSASIWHLADVLTWLQARGNYSLTRDVLDVAQEALQVNVAKEGLRFPGMACEELDALVG